MKTWEKPVLIVLTRNAAESVLSFCKGQQENGVGAAAINGSPSNYYGACMVMPAATGVNCLGCQQLDLS